MLSVLIARPKRTLLAVALFVVFAGVVGGPVAGSLQSDGGFTAGDSGSARAEARIEQATGAQASPGIVALVDDSRPRRGGPRATAEPTRGRLGRTAAGQSRRTLGVGRGDPRSGRRRGGGRDRARRALRRATGASRSAAPPWPAARSATSVSEDLGRAELLAFPVLLLLSLLFFRGRATILPLAVGITTVLGTFLALTAVNQAYALSIFALNLVIGLGLGLAIDYTLFLVTRYREELAKENPDAIRTTMRTAGRTVVFSAITVAAALITLTVFPLGFLKSMGIAGAVVALVAGAASLVIAPATFAVWGEKLRVKPRRTSRGGWYRLAHAVMRRPLPVALATGALMLLLTLPALRAVWTPIDASVIPQGQSSRTVADALDRDFGGRDTSPIIVVTGDPSRAERYAALPGVRAVSEPRRLDDGAYQVDVVATGAPEGETARAVVRELREDPDVLVAGQAAAFIDQQDAIASSLPLALTLLVALTFIVLWLMTGSIVLPFKAILMNALTVGSALGILTLVFQDGRFESLLGYTPNGGVEPTDFLVAAALVFALSTDYGVFLLGRIKEAREGGLSDSEAVAVGVERTGAVVTAAAILLAVAIGAFITSSISFIQQIGVATAAGVLIDAFIVRALLVPSLMALLGKWNWWSPKSLTRLHDRIGLREEAQPA